MRSRQSEVKRRWLKRVGVLVVLLLIGAAVNVGLAWGCVLWSPRFIRGGAIVKNVEETIDRGQWVSNWKIGAWAEGSLTEIWPQDGEIREGGVMPMAARGVGVAAAAVMFEEKGQVATCWRLLCRAGWPMYSLRCVGEQRFGVWGWRGGLGESDWPHWIKHIRPQKVGNWMPSSLPMRLIVGGFAVNTALYASASGVVGFACAWTFGAVRRHWRRRRRGCVGCGYDVGDLAVCPECGRERDQETERRGTKGTRGVDEDASSAAQSRGTSRARGKVTPDERR